MSAPASQWLPLHIEAYLGGTNGWTLEQSGAYLLMLMESWNKGDGLPDDDATLARICRTTLRRWNAGIKSVVLGKWRKIEGVWKNRRLEIERAKALELHARKSLGAKATNASRWQKPLDNPVTSDVAERPAERIAERSDSAPPVPSPKVPRKKQEEISLPPVARQPAADIPLLEHPEPLPERVAEQPGTELILEPPKQVEKVSDADQAVAGWNATARSHGLATVREVTGQRRDKLMKILRRHGLEGWQQMLDELATCPWCQGENDRGWRVDFDFVMRPDKFLKVLEGGFRRGRGPKPKQTAASALPLVEPWEQDDAAYDAQVDRLIGSRVLEHV